MECSTVCSLAGRDVGLTPNEFRIVSLLAAHAGQVLTYKYILRELWGPAASSDNKILRVHMANIRRKLSPIPTSPSISSQRWAWAIGWRTARTSRPTPTYK